MYLWVDQFLDGLLQVSNYLGNTVTHPTDQVTNWIRLPSSSLVVPPDMNSRTISTKISQWKDLGAGGR